MAAFGPNTQIFDLAFAGGPIIVEVGSTGVPSGAKMVMLKLQVDTETDEGRDVFLFSMDADGGNILSIDISSAVRSALSAFRYTSDLAAGATATTYPKASYGLTVWDEYMQDGEVYETAKVTYQGRGTAILGSLSEFDRFSLIGTPDELIKNLDFFTRKPAGDVCQQGEKVLVSKFVDGTVTTYKYATDNLTGKQTLGGWEVTVLPASAHRRQFLFVNSLGVLENVSAVMRESLTYDVESETFSLHTSPSYQASASIMTQKNAPRAKWEMSSGFVGRDWAEWWASEFLCASQHWMLYGKGNRINPAEGEDAEFDLWLPCAVSPANKSVQIYDRAKQQLPHIDFNVEVAVSGSIRSRLRV